MAANADNPPSPSPMESIMQRADHVLIHLTLEPAQGQTLPPSPLGVELAAYVRALLENLDAPPIVVGASETELTLVAPLPATMSTSHLVFCIKQSSERWLQQTTDSPDFRWAPGYRALSVDLRTLAVTIRRIRRSSTSLDLTSNSRWIHERSSPSALP